MDHLRTSHPARSPRRRIAALPLCAAAALLAAGCSADAESGSVTPRDATTSSTPTTTQLTIQVTDAGTTTWTLSCDPAGGEHPDPEAACAVLAKNGEQAMPQTPADSVCTQIYGGQQTAVITGLWRGQRLDASFSREDGCEISRWDSLRPLLPSASGSSSQ